MPPSLCPAPLSPFCYLTAPATVLMFHTGSLHSLQADINRLSTKLQQSTTSSKGPVTDRSLQADINRLSTKLQQSTTSSKGLVTDESWKQLSAQCDSLMRNRVTLRNSQPLPSAWGWMGEEPPGTTVGNLNKRIAALEDALDAEKRYSIAAHSCLLWEPTLAAR